uniref:Integral membrane protein n=1 Tax=Streptomyces sp. NBC_00003 TaxID=2903608 RepID=A0AAU2VFJ3_9ACTN
MTAATAGIQWAHKEDERWAASFKLRFVTEFHPPKGLVDQVLSEVHEVVTETGRPARDLFGEPRAYAARVAADRVDETHPSGQDLGSATPGERFTNALTMAGLWALLLSTVHWIRDGVWAEVSPASLGGIGALTAGVVVGCLVGALRTAGRVQAARACASAAAVAVVAGIVALAALPRHGLFTLPVPVLCAMSAAVMAGAHRLPDTAADRWFTRQRSKDSEQWTQHLDGLLRGAHGIPADQAREHVAEVRSHLASASGLTAQGEFGDVETYAARLAAGPRRTKRVLRRKAHLAGILAAAIAVANLDVLRSAEVTSLWFWAGALATAFTLGNAAMQYRDFRHQR